MGACEGGNQGGTGSTTLPPTSNTPTPDQLPQPVPPDADIQLQRQLVAEYHLRNFKKIAWLSLDRKATNEDGLYHEAVEQIFTPPRYFQAFAQINPSVQDLIKYGIDERKDALFRVSTKVLDDLGFGDDVIRIGDKIVWDGVEYAIWAIHRENQWLNTNIPLELALVCQRWRQGE